jgi:hypothetical protein
MLTGRITGAVAPPFIPPSCGASGSEAEVAVETSVLAQPLGARVERGGDKTAGNLLKSSFVIVFENGAVIACLPPAPLPEWRLTADRSPG